MKSRYEEAKNVFVDSTDSDAYIELNASTAAFEQLEKSISKPLKMILLFGKPGTGKSILLNQLAKKLKRQKEIYYFKTPLNSEDEFFYQLCTILNQGNKIEKTHMHFTSLIDRCNEMRGEREIIILLDEAQLYSREMMEKIRLISDTRSIKFVVSLHKTEDEDVIAKAHFQSRIWETIELTNATKEDLLSYIHKKLMKKSLYELINSFKEKEMDLVYKYTHGNYRECNKLLYTIFEICEYYEKNDPSKVEYARIPKRIIEMAALKLGYIHA